MKNLAKNFLVFFIIFLAMAAIFSTFSNNSESVKVGIETMIQELNQDQIKSLSVSGDTVKIELKDGSRQTVRKESGESLSSLLSNFQISPDKLNQVAINVQEPSGWLYWLGELLPFILPLFFLGLFFFLMMRSAQGMNNKAMNFGQSNAKEFDLNNKNQVTFKDVAGVKEAKEELYEVVEFLKYPKKFQDLGARIPRGVLLLGGPGTGKTLLARAVAGEAKVPFFHMSGSEFVEMFVGVGASRVRSLFQKAKKHSPCIVFIDEIDAVGRRRGSGLGGSHDEREQTLNQILVEMDGFEATQNIIVIAATNRPDVLDPALLRPGRFDRQVVIDRPDLKDREEILKVHSQKKPLAKEVDLKRIAERTPGFSGADLANLLNEASILSARKNKKVVEMEELFSAIEKVMIGPERKSRIISDKEKKITAYHEAGHALVAHFLVNSDPVQKVSIIARGQAGGYTLKVPVEDRYFHSRTDFIDEIAVLLAGHLVEKEIFGEVTTGATSDLRQATLVARSLITDYGMSDLLGPRTFGQKEELIFLGREIHEQRDYSEKIAEQIDIEILNFINQASVKAKEVLARHRDKLEKVAQALLTQETLEKEAFEALVGPAASLENKEA
ncbi:MAG TPA: ATP-dependent zinc metalloprotease FtsH [bacterium]|jgi:cell division protease FtsH|nr:MAG: ATP-dependent zinc metalloprotease FtsH [Parcubacteria group bacterium ADurb.Bin115]HNU81629.1 ATP-dependent zinc metalloprotease FtsH [bacterium]HOD87196.1 ATP-dependent zinc metalloprotease FtsH [bacterium]HPW05575.1 ATP-dependent zinc metalloprotease FtsH [bacterium]HPY99200.1 ATP-dependent zinc metalloprotease FtsH [bacterium]